ncbi:hypothetical protein KCU59_g17, partial [Aureobasidium melanogenum]
LSFLKYLLRVVVPPVSCSPTSLAESVDDLCCLLFGSSRISVIGSPGSGPSSSSLSISSNTSDNWPSAFSTCLVMDGG